jgi:hypothetical protein
MNPRKLRARRVARHFCLYFVIKLLSFYSNLIETNKIITFALIIINNSNKEKVNPPYPLTLNQLIDFV